MLTTALILFVVAALVGLYMASRIFANAMPPWGAVILHGLFAAVALVMVLYAAYAGAQRTPVLVGAALRKVPPPKAVVVIHALAAVLGVVALLSNVLGWA